MRHDSLVPIPTHRALWRLLLAVALGLAATAPGLALFETPQPQILYDGAAPGANPGVTVIRDQAAFDAAIAVLDPPLGAASPNLAERTVLLVVGKERENACRETALTEITTRGFRATVSVEERLPARECACADVMRPPRAWLVVVGRIVRRAEIAATDTVVPCDETLTKRDAALPGPELLLVGSMDGESGGRILTTAEALAEACRAMNVADKCPTLDFATHRALILTGRARENGCRETRVILTEYTSPQEASFVVEESYPRVGQVCTMLYQEPRAWLYKVPAAVERARVVTREVR